MNYRLIHKTQYNYSENVTNYHGLACIMPKSLFRQSCRDFSLLISPLPDEVYVRTDYFGNTLHYFSIYKPHNKLTLLAKSIVETHSSMANDFFMTPNEVKEKFKADRVLKNELLDYMLPSPFVQWDSEINRFATDCFNDNQSFYQSARLLCRKIYTEFTYVPGFTTIHTPLKTVLREKKGVCQDFSHLAIACLRSMGFAARYVSGYLETQPLPGKPKLQGSDATHAWVSVYVPDVGWCDFDPTNDLVPQERHITTAWGRDFGDVSPLKGIIFSTGKHAFQVAVDVTPF
ncbi:transglutaminase family protein [Spirosoma sp. HMF4905]|uniref:Transglutaminase family protein n=1 Tax=Spirosoma arboris TaxID=2682092 RepID=A0A7K1S606_9BACT|nr:transglutaminase family protein [Spirosoma arboris]MVM29251.1 transglutaminase family protein [Spirosoma arboris]